MLGSLLLHHGLLVVYGLASTVVLAALTATLVTALWGVVGGPKDRARQCGLVALGGLAVVACTEMLDHVVGGG